MTEKKKHAAPRCICCGERVDEYEDCLESANGRHCTKAQAARNLKALLARNAKKK